MPTFNEPVLPYSAPESTEPQTPVSIVGNTYIAQQGSDSYCSARGTFYFNPNGTIALINSQGQTAAVRYEIVPYYNEPTKQIITYTYEDGRTRESIVEATDTTLYVEGSVTSPNSEPGCYYEKVVGETFRTDLIINHSFAFNKETSRDPDNCQEWEDANVTTFLSDGVLNRRISGTSNGVNTSYTLEGSTISYNPTHKGTDQDNERYGPTKYYAITDLTDDGFTAEADGYQCNLDRTD